MQSRNIIGGCSLATSFWGVVLSRDNILDVNGFWIFGGNGREICMCRAVNIKVNVGGVLGTQNIECNKNVAD